MRRTSAQLTVSIVCTYLCLQVRNRQLQSALRFWSLHLHRYTMIQILGGPAFLARRDSAEQRGQVERAGEKPVGCFGFAGDFTAPAPRVEAQDRVLRDNENLAAVPEWAGTSADSPQLLPRWHRSITRWHAEPPPPTCCKAEQCSSYSERTTCGNFGDRPFDR